MEKELAELVAHLWGRDFDAYPWGTLTDDFKHIPALERARELNGECIGCGIDLKTCRIYYGAGKGGGQRYRCESCYQTYQSIVNPT